MVLITQRFLQSALIYAQRLNWNVFPLRPKSKIPITKHGFLDANKNPEQIKKWFINEPNSNIAVATGEASGFFVLDIDPRHNGHISLEELISEYGELPDTVQAETGGGGSHYLFKYRQGIGNKQNLLPGIDIKGDGGYIVIPPSIHPDTDKEYTWELSSRPIENEIAEAPEWLLNMIMQPKEQTIQVKPSEYWTDLFNNTNDGTRNNNATSLAGYLFRRYVDPALVVEIMKAWNERVNPPLEEEQLNTVINSVAGIERRRREGKEFEKRISINKRTRNKYFY